MSEEFLYFLWQYQLFDFQHLQTEDGEVLSVIHPGVRNHHAGPDFSQVSLEIGGLEWAGNVEIHVRSADWYLHGHQGDPRYDSVILHVVWEHDRDVFTSDGVKIPVLALRPRINLAHLERYRRLQEAQYPIPCTPFLPEVSSLIQISMLDKMAIHRLEQKAEVLHGLLEENKGDWRQSSYQFFGMGLGFNVNKEGFRRLTDLVPIKYLLKHRDNLFQLQALLFGMAGFLRQAQDDFSARLKKEFELLAGKYGWSNKVMLPQEWNFGKLRPPNFPTRRIGQLAQFVHQNGGPLDLLLTTTTLSGLMSSLGIENPDYWKHHHQFGEESAKVQRKLGKESVGRLVANVVNPLLVFWSRHKADEAYAQRALQFLQELPAENNRVTRIMEEVGFQNSTALDSQALMHLHGTRCQLKKCLHCTIGVHILKRKSTVA